MRRSNLRAVKHQAAKAAEQSAKPDEPIPVSEVVLGAQTAVALDVPISAPADAHVSVAPATPPRPSPLAGVPSPGGRHSDRLRKQAEPPTPPPSGSAMVLASPAVGEGDSGGEAKKSRKLSFSEAVSEADPGLPFDPMLGTFAYEWDRKNPFGLQHRWFYTDAGGVLRGECRVSGKGDIRLLDTGLFLGWKLRLPRGLGLECFFQAHQDSWAGAVRSGNRPAGDDPPAAPFAGVLPWSKPPRWADVRGAAAQWYVRSS